MFEEAIGLAMLTPDEVSPDTAANLQVIHAVVCRQMFCGICKGIMDSRKSVLVERPDMGEGGTVICGEGWDGFTPEPEERDKFVVTDSRDYNLDGTRKGKRDEQES